VRYDNSRVKQTARLTRRKAIDVKFTIDEITSQIQKHEYALRYNQIKLAEENVIGNNASYEIRRIEESKKLISFWQTKYVEAYQEELKYAKVPA
jgi:hypothetical protein